MESPHAAFTVTSTRTPTITWRCPTCHRPERFACSERFRTNSNGKTVDVWLIYRCWRCDATKNVTVVDRTPVRKVPVALLRAAEANDADVARRLARDVGLLRRAGVTVAEGDGWTIAPARPIPTIAVEATLGLRLVFPEALLVRLDAVVSAVTGVPRALVRDALRLPPTAPRPDALRLWSTVDVEVRSQPAEGAHGGEAEQEQADAHEQEDRGPPRVRRPAGRTRSVGDLGALTHRRRPGGGSCSWPAGGPWPRAR